MSGRKRDGGGEAREGPVPPLLPSKARCKASKRDGGACQAPALADGFCAFHSPAKRKAFKAGRAAGGRERMRPRAVTPASEPIADLSSTEAVTKYIGALIAKVERGQIDARIGNTLAVLLNCQLRGLSSVETLKRIERLEAAVKALPNGEGEAVGAELASLRRAAEGGVS